MGERLGLSRTPSLSEVLSLAIEQRLSDVHVALPASVVSYDPTRQTVDVRPLIKHTYLLDDGTQEVEDVPIISDVPVCFPRAGGYFLALPIVTGDNVLLVFVERSIDNYVFSDGVAALDPVDLRKHDLSDAVAVPGFFPLAKSLKEELLTGAVFGAEHGSQVRATGQAIEITTAGASASIGGFVAMAQLVLVELNKIKTALDTHVHAGVTAGPATTGPATPLYFPGVVASGNLKAD